MTKAEIKAEIKQINTKLDELLADDRRIKQAGYEPWMTELLLEMNEQGIKGKGWTWEKSFDCRNKRDLNRQKSRLEFMLNPHPDPDFIGTGEIEMAKNVPIDQFIEFHHKVAHCLWHEDKHPSMTFFPRTNTVKCFACGVSEDVIGVVQKLFGLTFLEAVKRLIA